MDDVAWCASAGAVCSQALDSQRAGWGLHVDDGGRDILRACGCGCEEMLKCSKHSGDDMAVCCVRVQGHIAQGGTDEGDCGPCSAGLCGTLFLIEAEIGQNTFDTLTHCQHQPRTLRSNPISQNRSSVGAKVRYIQESKSWSTNNKVTGDRVTINDGQLPLSSSAKSFWRKWQLPRLRRPAPPC